MGHRGELGGGRLTAERFEDLVLEYQGASAPGQESPRKIELLAQLARSADARVFAFLVEVAAADDYDLARIEALRSFEFRATADPQQGPLVLEMLECVLRNDEDDLVRAHAALALSGQMKVAGAVRIAGRHALDPDDDLDVRHNALFALERGGPSLESIELLRRGVTDPALGAGCLRVLAAWGAPPDGDAAAGAEVGVTCPDPRECLGE